jgi:hypothetical protein
VLAVNAVEDPRESVVVAKVVVPKTVKEPVTAWLPKKVVVPIVAESI